LDFAISHWELLRSLIEPTSQPAYVPDLLSNAWDLRLIDKLNAFAEHQIPPNARQGVVKSEAHIPTTPRFAMTGCPRSIGG
jgi:hypothetical protein